MTSYCYLGNAETVLSDEQPLPSSCTMDAREKFLTRFL
jgi:hypothetical protein